MYYIIINEVSDYQWSVKIKTQKYYKIIFVFLKKFDTAYKQDCMRDKNYISMPGKICKRKRSPGKPMQVSIKSFLCTGILFCQMLFFSTVLFIFANFAFSFTCRKLIYFFSFKHEL